MEELAAIDPALVVVSFAVAAALVAGVNVVALVAELPALAVPAAVALCAALAVLAAPATSAVTDHSSVVQLDRHPGLGQPLSFHLP